MNIERVINEKNPFIREIWATGYDKIIEDIPMQVIKLVDTKRRYIKEIGMMEWNQMRVNTKIKTGSNLAGSTHSWIAESDGSANRFRELIKPEHETTNI